MVEQINDAMLIWARIGRDALMGKFFSVVAWATSQRKRQHPVFEEIYGASFVALELKLRPVPKRVETEKRLLKNSEHGARKSQRHLLQIEHIICSEILV